MKFLRSAFALLIFFFIYQSATAQPFTIKGVVIDTLNANHLQYATVTLIRASDSILETFTRSKQDGKFSLQTPKADKYIIMITFPSFADYVDVVTVNKDKPTVDMGTIPMISKSHLLSEFVLKQQIGAIKIKGDTTEYVADSFAVREGATVEELLKKLPGIQVNKNGEVTAQGEKVQKILVDGEEFFTDDPAVVTKSLQAKAIDKVQVFDKKSDQAEFTGIDDGSREKTINLQLKDKMKKGYFGKVNVGGGTDGYFENQAMLNAFKGKRKLSVFGIVANTGKIGLGWEDRDKFGSGSNVEMTDDGVYNISGDDDDMAESWNGTYTGQGLPSAWTGGLHYSNKWLEDKLHLSGNYRYAKQNIETVNNNLSQTALPGAKLYQDERKNSYSFGERHRADLLYEWKIDSSSQLKLTANASYSETKSGNTINQTSFFVADTSIDITDTLNNGYSRSNNDATKKSQNASLLYQKKFAKKGRTISLNIDEGYRNQDATGFLFVHSNYFDPKTHTVDSVGEIDQLKRYNSTSFQLSGKLSYTEPLSKIMFLELNYSPALSNNTSKRLSFDKDITETRYDVLDDTTSSNYDYNYLINTGGANLRFVLKKMNFSFGGSVSNTYFSQEDNLTSRKNYSRSRSYNNFFPHASFIYRVPGKQSSFRFNYNGNTHQPTMDQIQPLVQNSDPNNLVVGNENLKQEFRNSFNLSYNSYKILSGTYTYISAGGYFVNDAISQSQTTSNDGRSVYQYINVNGNYNSWAYGGYGKTFQKLNLRVGAGLSASLSHITNYINGIKNESSNNRYELSIPINYDKEKVCDISYRPVLIYNQNTATINTNATNYWSLEHNFDGSVELPLKFQIGTEVQWYIRQQVAQFDQNNDAFLWNAYVSKKFFKNNNLELRAYVNDILNQNIGFQRFGHSNIITEQNYNTIKRYGMLSLIWNFTKAPGGTPNTGSGIIIND
ncbi:MAG TPA: outer membrane beta-barrel protein [Flavipsychrobacter sp.]|nr:outer membrane beta-barrel protein [Flavipsychrobacter sp.]